MKEQSREKSPLPKGISVGAILFVTGLAGVIALSIIEEDRWEDHCGPEYEEALDNAHQALADSDMDRYKEEKARAKAIRSLDWRECKEAFE